MPLSYADKTTTAKPSPLKEGATKNGSLHPTKQHIHLRTTRDGGDAVIVRLIGLSLPHGGRGGSVTVDKSHLLTIDHSQSLYFGLYSFVAGSNGREVGCRWRVSEGIIIACLRRHTALPKH